MVEFEYTEQNLSQIDLTQQIIAGVVSGISFLIQLNAARYEGCAFRTLFILLSAILDISVIGLFFPSVVDSEIFRTIKAPNAIVVFVFCNQVQSLLLWVYSLIKASQVESMMHRARIIDSMRASFNGQLILRVLGLGAVIAGVAVLWSTGKQAGAYIALAGLVMFVVGYIWWIHFLNRLRCSDAPISIKRIFWSSVGEVLFVVVIAGVYLALIHTKLGSIISEKASHGDYAVALAFALVYASPITIGIYKLIRVGLVGYTIWDILFLSSAEVDQEYIRSDSYAAIQGNRYLV
jgi:hypothetical protein